MRAGGYTVQHTLTSEAATVVKQALGLAKRRGHAQVTPLHVASAMLTSSTGLLRNACLQSHSHQLQCKALELCFNVALNRLPTSQSSGSILSPHHQAHHPSLSNALVAAFKRAQAHQRRGSIENQQQPILALKVEIEQLVISILDDPSVSRVMREAGFLSSQVKNNVEQSVEIISSQSPPMSSCQSKENIKLLISQFPLNSTKSKFDAKVRDEDVMSVIDTMMDRKRKNTTVISECLASAEDVVRGVIDKLERENDIFPNDLRFVQFVSLPLNTLSHLSREEVEGKVRELRYLVNSYVGRGVILYLGDLKWVSDFWSNYCNREQSQRMNNYYSPVEHMIMELSRLVFGIGDSVKLWLMGIATFQTYMRCKTGHPSLETIWDLYPLTIPVGTLSLTLNLKSDLQDEFRSKVTGDGLINWVDKAVKNEKQLTCCGECSVNFAREARSIASCTLNNEYSTTTTSTTSTLPSWLQQYKQENTRHTSNIDQEYDKVRSLRKKWNSICTSLHKQPPFLDKAFHFSSPSTSMSSPNHLNWPIIFESNQSPKEHQFFTSDQNDGEGFQANLKAFMPAVEKPDLLSNPNSSPNSVSCSEASVEDMECLHKFKEVNSENLEILVNALEKRVPWQRGVISEIANTILQCRSGMVTRKRKVRGELVHEEKEETWLLFLGVDAASKGKIARELAKVVFGTKSNFIPIGLSAFSSTRADSTDQEFSNKRARDEHGQSYLERFAEAVQENPSRVFFMEDVEQVGYHSQMGIKKAIETGKITLPVPGGHEHILLKDAIVIFSCESSISVSRACSPTIRRKYCESEHDHDMENGDGLGRKKPSTTLDLNIATDDHNGEEHSVSDIGILDSVDKQVIFKIQML